MYALASELVPPPGTFIREELDARSWTQRDLAFVLGCPEQAVNMIISGKRGIRPDRAKALGDAFDVPAEFFMNLQKAFDLSRAKEPDPNVARRARLQEHYPVREMIKRGWLEQTDTQMLEVQLMRFFKVSSYEEIPHLRHAAKKTHHDHAPPAQLVWLFRVRQIAETMIVGRFSEARLRDALNELAKLLLEPEETRHVARILAECGVRFVIVEPLPQSKIDGVCFWLDKNSPVIGLSLRRDQIDNFWFVLRHEIEHVLQKHGQKEECLDEELAGEHATTSSNILEEEQIANAAAEDFCVARAEFEDFVARVHPFFSEQRVVLFARRIHVHPGLVVGQPQFRLSRYDFLKKYLTKVRHFVIQTAMTDGWGQAAPVSSM